MREAVRWVITGWLAADGCLASPWYATLGRRKGAHFALATIAPIATAATFAIVAEPSVAHARERRQARSLNDGEIAFAPADVVAPVASSCHRASSLAAKQCVSNRRVAQKLGEP
jgi:hypothetical protein